MNKQLYLLLAPIIFTTCQNPNDLLLHVPSPEWEDQIVYFIMTDRFFDGNPNNNELGMGEYDPEKGTHFNGGDLVGIQQQLDYIAELGATAVWITPPVLNQWWNPEKNFTGYHGYWASNFEKVDPHFGNLEDYKRLSDALHRRGMYLIQDVVTNHTGDYFRYPDGYDAADVAKNYVNYGAPEQSPFDQNDPRNKSHREAAIYNFTPVISDYKNPAIRETYQTSNLDDLNTTNQVVIEKLIRSFQYWIEAVGVDGYRFDTAIYVDHEFWHRFMHGGQGGPQGISPFAKTTGREAFYTFGETWISSQPFGDDAEKEIKKYLGTSTKPEMDAVLNFPLQQSIKRVFADGEPTAQMSYRLQSLQKHFPKTTSLVNFIDNHDMARFRALASEESYQQALLFLMTMPGMPVIYQGTEQGEKEVRDPLFEKLNTASEEFLFVKKLTQFRKDNGMTRKGKVEVLADSEYCPGLLIYRLEKDGEELYAAFNTSENALLTGGLFLKNDEAANSIEEVLSLRGGTELVLENGHLRLLSLPPKEGFIFKIKNGEPAAPADLDIHINNPSGTEVTATTTEMTLRGDAKNADSVFVVFDGNMGLKKMAVLSGGKWQAVLDLKNTLNGPHFWQAVAMRNGKMSISEKINFLLDLPEVKRAAVTDPIGDDFGPNGKYQYPTDPTFGRQMDIKSATVHSIGNNIRLDVEMAHPFSTVWNPLNGFDHLVLMAFVDLPEKSGTAILPKINMSLPVGEEWDYGVAVGGWAMSSFGEAGQKPLLKVLPEKNTIQLYFSGSALGYPASLQGAKIYLYTWDGGGEGELRPLKEEAGPFDFGGGKMGDPKFMDEVRLELE